MSRFRRQSAIIDPDTMASLGFMVVGTGAIGRQVALQLVMAGAQKLAIWDFDKVEEHNLPNQGWPEDAIGKYKTDAMEDDLLRHNAKLGLAKRTVRFTGESFNKEQMRRPFKVDVAISAVDSMDARTEFYDTIKDHCKLFVDGRMTAESCRIIAATPESLYYPSTLFNQAEMQEGPCAAKSTIYCANIAAGYMVAMVTRWMREPSMTYKHDFAVNIPNYIIETL